MAALLFISAQRVLCVGGESAAVSTASHGCSSHLPLGTRRELGSHSGFSLRISNVLELMLDEHHETGTSLRASQKLHLC